MAKQDPHDEDRSLQAPDKLLQALRDLQKNLLFVPPAVDQAVLKDARAHLQRITPRPLPRRPWLPWAAMAAGLALAIWLGERWIQPTPAPSFARDDLNHDGNVDILDAFALAAKIETGGTLDLRWDINGDGRVDRYDVAAIAARAVSLDPVAPEPRKRQANAPIRRHPATRMVYSAIRHSAMDTSWLSCRDSEQTDPLPNVSLPYRATRRRRAFRPVRTVT
jgi:hypothetical protein